MRNPTIWESANRPLLVRSVWIDSDGYHRHFILDYENQPKTPDVAAKLKKGPLRSAVSLEVPDIKISNLRLVGSSKACKPQIQQRDSSRPTPAQRKSAKSPQDNNILELLKKRGTTAGTIRGVGSGDGEEGKSFQQNGDSKRSSLQDLNSTENTCDDKLAERVLNWLDLAGKTTILRPNSTNAIGNLHHHHPKTPSANSVNKKEKPNRGISIRAATTHPIKRPDSVKHITIIFNKEGIPVRYNRPIRFSDLFRSGFSASRKFAQNLYTARYNRMTDSGQGQGFPNDPGNSAFDKTATDVAKSRANSSNVKRKTFESDYKPVINKQLLEDCNMHEVKKQLHIFMPSLPKKTLQPTDCESSCLSTVVSEQK